MMIFRRRGTAQLSPVFAPFAFALPNFGQFVDTTTYTIFGTVQQLRTPVHASAVLASPPAHQVRSVVKAHEQVPA